METMSVLEGFSEYEAGTRVHHARGDEITVSTERADQLRERGLARKKPALRKREQVIADGSGKTLPEVSDERQVEDPINPGTA